MPFRHLKLRRLLMRLFVAITLGAGLFGLGAAVIIWQTVFEVQQDATWRLQRARLMLDQTFNNAEQAVMNVQGLLGKPCAEVDQILREQVAMQPDVRTVNLALKGRIYCTSIYGAYDSRVRLRDFVAGQLALLRGNSATTDRPLVVFRKPFGEGSVLVGIDGYYLITTLDLSSNNSPLSLMIGQRTLSSDGLLSEISPPSVSGELGVSSEHYPYRLSTTLTRENYLEHAWRHSRGSIILYPLLALLVGGGAFWWMGRSRSPSEELKRALVQGEFIPYLQPVVTGSELRCHGCEVLMRWQHPKQGMISPARFIPLAEDSGLIVPMTSVMMAQVRDYFAPRAHELPSGFHFGFNICASHCKDMNLVNDCRSFINAFKDHPITLVLELTERELIVADEVTDQLFAELHQLGVQIAIDDFGTGHSSLTYLQQFKVDLLKIDQSFVGMIGSDALSSHIVENVIDLATRLGLQLVAEGVENQVQADYLQARDVDFLQGYFYGRPMPMKEFASMLRG